MKKICRSLERSNKKKNVLSPLFYFVLFALSILIFVTYYVWNYIQTQPSPHQLIMCCEPRLEVQQPHRGSFLSVVRRLFPSSAS